MPTDPIPAELPDDLADRMAEQLLGVGEPQRSLLLQACIDAHPEHAAGLRRLAEELVGADRVLDGTFPDTVAPMPTHVGGHRVLQQLGEGAFGVVYLCAQESPVVRKVAIKVLRPGAGDDRTLRRFAAERQLLATLNHPAITQVFDAGVMPDGRPFFVMEYVEGLPLGRYCSLRGLSFEQRLRLFADVCRGVAHAHSRRIVHRDLKPANVLVVDSADGPVPKIIDFGIAKALDVTDAGDGQRTDAGRVIGTPGYMSPEQAAGQSLEVDERADVFSLGVMLYELLTEQLPWARGAAATDTDPVRPSARVTTSTSSTADGTPAAVRSRAAKLRGDLDWITLKALAREREQRYATVNELLADIERHLRGETVSVGPPSLRYRLRKFVRRNRSLVATAGGALLVLGVGLGGAIAYGSSAKAEATAAKSSAAASFAESMSFVERLVSRAKDAQMVDAPATDRARQSLLQDAVESYDRLLRSHPSDPELRVRRCRALVDISQVHLLLGELARAGSIAGTAVEEAQTMFAADTGDLGHRALVAESLRQQGRCLALAGNHEAAHPLLAAAAEHFAACAAMAPETYGRDHAAVLREAADTLAAEQGEASLAGMRESLTVLDALRRDHASVAGLIDDHVETCTAIAIQLFAMRRFADAKAMLDTAEQDLPQVTTERTRCLLRIRQQQGQCAWWLGDRPQGIRYTQQAVEAAEAWLREQPQRLQPQEFLARALRDLGVFQNYVGNFAESNAAFRRAVEQADAMVLRFPEDPSRLASLCRILRTFAQTLWDRFRIEDLAEAKACAARATATNDRIAPTVGVNRQSRWLLLAVEAGIAESQGTDASDLWQAVAADVPIDAALRAKQDQHLLAMACLGIANWHCLGERDAAARQWLERTREAIERSRPLADKMQVDVGWIEAQLAVRTGDHVAAAAAAARILAARNTWFAHQRAGDCLFLAWRCAAAAPVPDAAVLQDYHQRATSNYGDVLDSLRGDVGEPLDPWYVLPWGWSCIRTAQLAASVDDAKKAIELLHAALPKLAAVQATAHADQWQAATFAEGRALLDRLLATDQHR